MDFRALLACSRAVLRHWQVSLITDIFAGLFKVFALPYAQPCMLAHPHACKPTHIPAVQTRRSADATSSTIFDTLNYPEIPLIPYVYI